MAIHVNDTISTKDNQFKIRERIFDDIDNINNKEDTQTIILLY